MLKHASSSRLVSGDGVDPGGPLSFPGNAAVVLLGGVIARSERLDSVGFVTLAILSRLGAGIDPGTYRAAEHAGRVQQDIPVNHSPTFAPVIQPTLDTGTHALVTAALAWL